MKIHYTVPSRTTTAVKTAWGCYATCCATCNTGSNDFFKEAQGH